MANKLDIRIQKLTPRNFERILSEVRDRRNATGRLEAQVRKIIKEVADRGNAALVELTERFDGVRLKRRELRVEPSAIKAAYQVVTSEQLSALKFAKRNIEKCEQRWLKNTKRIKIEHRGVQIRSQFKPIDSVGCYVPGGKAAYPSTVLMNVVPAKMAKVKRIVVCSPPVVETSEINPLVLVAADLCGVDEIYRVGGVQAIAALACGTETIAPVDKIVGPGNQYVTAAKLMVSSRVGIDMPAGPSELLILADGSSGAIAISWDMIAQAEHSEDSVCGLLTSWKAMADATVERLNEILPTLERREIVARALSRHGFILYTDDDLDLLIRFVNAFAPEHVEIQTWESARDAERITSAGLILVGHDSMAAVSDYAIGTNHVLPTGGLARACSGLSVLDFMKRLTLVDCPRPLLKRFLKPVKALALAEGLPNHYLALDERIFGVFRYLESLRKK